MCTETVSAADGLVPSVKRGIFDDAGAAIRNIAWRIMKVHLRLRYDLHVSALCIETDDLLSATGVTTVAGELASFTRRALCTEEKTPHRCTGQRA